MIERLQVENISGASAELYSCFSRRSVLCAAGHWQTMTHVNLPTRAVSGPDVRQALACRSSGDELKFVGLYSKLRHDAEARTC